jgi:ABC-type branched-subunit amino acid transport system permease subunit
MTHEKFPALLSPDGHRSENPRLPESTLNKNRLAAMLTILAMLLIAALFGYRLQISPYGITFDRSESDISANVSAHKP